MAIINPSDFTMTKDIIKSVSEAVLKATFEKPNIEAWHTFIPGIKAKKQIVILGLAGLSGKKQTSCDWDENGNPIASTEKEWDPEYIGDRFVQCFTDLLENFWAWGLKNGVQKDDLTETDFALFVESRITDASIEAVLRHAYFGDKAADTVANGGVLTNGTDPDYFNAIDGYWKQFFDIVAADADRRVTIAKNAQATYALQRFNDTDTTNDVATNIFQNLIYEADFRLRGANNKVIVATQSLVDQYARERKKRAGEELAYIRRETGIDSFFIDNVEIFPFNFMDRMIRTYEDDGTKFNLPHRAFFTTRDNLQVGSETTDSLATLDPFYDQKSKQYYVDYGFLLDVKVIEDDMVQVAY